MRAERGHGVHARRRVDEAGRGERGHRARGRAHLVPAAAGRQLRVRPHLRHRVHPRVGHGHGRQQLGGGGRRELGEPGGDEGAQRVAVGVAVGVARVVGVLGQLGTAEEARAEPRPLALVLDGHHHGLAVTGHERAVRVDRGVRGPGPRRGRRAVVAVVEREAHPLHRGLQHGHVHHRAMPGPAALQQRGQHAGVGVHARRDVRHRDPDLGGRVRRAGDRDEARLALHHQVVGLHRRVGAAVAVAGDVAHDEAGMRRPAARRRPARGAAPRRGRGSARTRPRSATSRCRSSRPRGSLASSASDSLLRFTHTKCELSPLTRWS